MELTVADAWRAYIACSTGPLNRIADPRMKDLSDRFLGEYYRLLDEQHDYASRAQEGTF